MSEKERESGMEEELSNGEALAPNGTAGGGGLPNGTADGAPAKKQVRRVGAKPPVDRNGGNTHGSIHKINLKGTVP